MDCQPHNKSQVYIWLKNKQSCLLCDEPGDSSHPLCTPCESELPWLLDGCQTCALPLPMSGLTCGHCLKRPPSFEQVIAPWTYRFPVDSLITRFKHQSQWPLGRLLAELLAEALRERFDTGLPRPDLLLPVPLAIRRQRQRGYNQAAMLMDWLGQSLEIPVDEHRLLRIQDTVAQQDLDARARRRNLLNAFALAPGARVEGLHLALVDDVLTTGATAESLARLLLKAGARRIDVYCLARTPAPQSR
ncbi:ComF family protein [Pseudomonas gingeri NCPPB 3146 = LMG 5327]|uniref:ComF family protein n=2 Tax=Pseudomonas gingeri TaxID=117681 RepID=A0A7Y7XYN9_9PSED|nr:ComF family protein [Pseudomonas gingeri]NWC14717.1 ComF family protein [Pseudomonas gingeri]PNQ91238.1 ComF family protein [Pseudomonas gingeri NCPPB 3146 = LMG 5327]